MGLTTGKIVEILFEKAVETHESQQQLLDLVMFENPNPAQMQNAGNVFWKAVQQHAPIITGWDLTGSETGIIEETYPSILGTPSNDFVKMRVDDLRDKRFWENRGIESGRRQASELNKAIASAIALQGSLFYRSNATSGYDFIAEAQTMINERQGKKVSHHFLINDRDLLFYSSDLAGRQTLQGRPEATWKTGQIGSNIAEFDVHTGSYLPNLTGGADPAITVTGNQSFKPEGGSVNTSTGVVTNVDYRIASIVVSTSAGLNLGDKVYFQNAGTPVYAVGREDKTNTGQPMSFTVVGIPDGTHIQVYPKPIAVDDAALTLVERAYANINTTILDAATLERMNIDASAKTNLFWDKSAIEVIGGVVPMDLLKQFDGMKVVSDTMKNGQVMYMIYDGKLEDLTLRWRLFTWYGITVCNPMDCGVAVRF